MICAAISSFALLRTFKIQSSYSDWPTTDTVEVNNSIPAVIFCDNFIIPPMNHKKTSNNQVDINLLKEILLINNT